MIVLSKFNTINNSYKPNTKTHEGADAFQRDPVQAWLNMLFSSFLENQYYESSNSQMQRFLELTDKVAYKYGYPFVGKAAIFVRNELGMRSISQLTAAWLNDKSFQEKRNFYKGFMHRPDDVAEIFGAVDYFGGKRSHALIRGSADYLSSLGAYQITKYKMSGHKYNMYDLINLTHATSRAICDFKHDKLDTPDTWENKISNAGSKESRDIEWTRLVEEGKLGYMALIRNLNNIMKINGINRKWILKYLVPQLIDGNKIRKSLIFPYRIYNAYKNLDIHNSDIDYALSLAFSKATSNVPKFDGHSAVILDVSGSMEDRISSKSTMTLKDIGACFAATLILNGSNVDFIKFGSYAKRKKYSAIEDAFTLIDKISANERCDYGTNIGPVMDIMHDNYDRIFLISDMQIFGNRYSYWYNIDRNETQEWCHKYGKIMTYSFDLANYDNQLEPPSNNFMFLTSLNDIVFKYINLMESSENIVNIINSISLT